MKMSRVATFNVSQINVSYFLFFHKTSLKQVMVDMRKPLFKEKACPSM
jgi:hypothetical protein